MSTLLRRTAIAIALFLCLSTLNSILAQEPARAPQSTTAPQESKNAPLNEAMHALFSAKSFAQTAISPDGKRVAWVENVAAGKSAIYVAEVSGASKPHRITAGKAGSLHAEDSIAWSPDSKEIAFLSDALKAGQQQL